VLLGDQPAVLTSAELVELAGNIELYPMFVGVDALGEAQTLTGQNGLRLPASGISLQRVADPDDRFFAATLVTDVWGNQNAELTEIQPSTE
jgi:hypothetical protein